MYCHKRIQSVNVREPLHLCTKTRVCIEQIRLANELQKCFPVRVVVHQCADVSILGLVRLAIRRQHARVAHGGDGRLPSFPAQMFAQYKLQQAFEHGYFDMLAQARAVTRDDCCHHGVHHIESCHAVCKRGGHITRLMATTLRHEPRHASGALNQIVVSRPVRVRPALAVAICTANYKFWIERMQGVKR